MKSLSVRWLSQFALLLALAGCAVTPHFEKPTLAVRGVEVESATFTEQRLRVKVVAHNPNGVDLPIRSIDYDVALAGETLGRGQTDASFVVPARGDAEFSMSVTTHVATVLMKILPKLKDGGRGIDYHINGTVRTGLAWFREFPFDEHGML
jgi:LEA14-like dessication related protein